jgi:hypothetical protein
MFVKKLLLSLAIIALATPAIARATSGPPIVDIHMKALPKHSELRPAEGFYLNLDTPLRANVGHILSVIAQMWKWMFLTG